MNQTTMTELLPLLPRPSHYLGTEVNSIHKNAANVSLRWGLAFPDLYEVGMSHLGLKILYHQLNSQPHIWAERVFAPPADAAGVFREYQLPLCTLESHTPLTAMHILGMSLTHELCYTSVLYVLDLAGIPFHSRDRDTTWPLLVAGGGACFNPEPMAPFFDLFVLGDGEDLVLELSQTFLAWTDSGGSKKDLLAELRHIPGLYIPDHFPLSREGQAPSPVYADTPKVEKRLVPDLNLAPFPTAQIVPFGKPVHDRFTLEVARGCTRGCRFCQAGMTMRPVRERSLSTLDSLLQAGLDNTGFEELSFLSLSTGDFSQLEALFAQSFSRCRQEQVAISLPSLRVGSLRQDLIQRMAALRRTGATLAPEAGSQRLRDVINKGVTEQTLLEHAHTLFAAGWKRLKLYFMIGLPTETWDDLQAIYDLCLQVREAAGKDQKRVQITASISLFVPKPHTPFQWEAQDDLPTAEAKISFLQSLFQRPKNLTLRWHDPEMSFVEGIFSRGDRSLAPVLEQAYALGDILTSWHEHFQLSRWQQALAQVGVDPAPFLEAKDPQRTLAWSHIQCGLRPEFLLRERNRALQAGATPDCRYQGCSRCGLCTLPAESSRLARQAQTTQIRPVVNQARRDQDCVPQKLHAGDAQPWQEKACAIQLSFEKTGPAAFLSQLELQTVLERILRRADLPLSFSQGFHPMPRISFAHALPVGVHSQDEQCVIILREVVSGEHICSRLNACSIAGLRFVQANEVPVKHKLAQTRFQAFDLHFNLPSEQAGIQARRWQEFLHHSSWIVSRQTKKGVREVDLRSRVRSAEQIGPTHLHLVFDWEPGYLSPMFIVHSLHPELKANSLQLCKKKSGSSCEPDLEAAL